MATLSLGITPSSDGIKDGRIPVELPRDYTLKSHWPDCSGMVAGIESEWWPDSCRNGGRFPVGTVAGFVRNTHMLKDAVFSKSTGDEPGTARGVASGTKGNIAKFVNYSFDVMVEGRNVCRRLDAMTSNKGNTPPAPLRQPNVQLDGLEGKFLLPVTFVFKEPDVITGKITQPVFSTLHTVQGPETFRQDTENYTGSLHGCETPEGDYELVFDEFNREEDSFE